jgi:DeoR/GlpR family transcriptional regulator of sugar metabolism
MKPKERQRHILNLLYILHKEWRVKELAERFHVSELTLRRDLDQLEKSGDVIRTIGGCVSIGENSVGTVFNNEFERNLNLKTAIGKEASQLIKSGDTILLGDGSTIFQFAACLGDMEGINIYTNNIAAITLLKKCGNIRLFILGGEYDYQYNMLLLKGSLTDRILETLNFDLIFIGTDAINAEGQCLSKNEEVSRTNQIILRRGMRKILLADHEKIKASGNVIYGHLSDFSMWITTEGIDDAQMKIYRDQTRVITIPQSHDF